MTNESFNVKSAKGYAGAVGRVADDSGRRLTEVRSVRPMQVYPAILKAHLKLATYVCNGMHWGLQTTDSEIMIDVLEKLANKGIVGLPLHDFPAHYFTITAERFKLHFGILSFIPC
jgi:hypothetical protein